MWPRRSRPTRQGHRDWHVEGVRLRRVLRREVDATRRQGHDGSRAGRTAADGRLRVQPHPEGLGSEATWRRYRWEEGIGSAEVRRTTSAVQDAVCGPAEPAYVRQ